MLNLYLDASALVKRYVREDASALVRETMQRADGWFICRIGFVETFRAVRLASGAAAGRTFEQEWPAFSVVEIDGPLTEHAARLAIERGLRSLDALHLAAALALPLPDLVFTTWDQRLHAAATAEGLAVVPTTLP